MGHRKTKHRRTGNPAQHLPPHHLMVLASPATPGTNRRTTSIPHARWHLLQRLLRTDRIQRKTHHRLAILRPRKDRVMNPSAPRHDLIPGKISLSFFDSIVLFPSALSHITMTGDRLQCRGPAVFRHILLIIGRNYLISLTAPELRGTWELSTDSLYDPRF